MPDSPDTNMTSERQSTERATSPEQRVAAWKDHFALEWGYNKVGLVVFQADEQNKPTGPVQGHRDKISSKNANEFAKSAAVFSKGFDADQAGLFILPADEKNRLTNKNPQDRKLVVLIHGQKDDKRRYLAMEVPENLASELAKIAQQDASQASNVLEAVLSPSDRQEVDAKKVVFKDFSSSTEPAEDQAPVPPPDNIVPPGAAPQASNTESESGTVGDWLFAGTGLTLRSFPENVREELQRYVNVQAGSASERRIADRLFDYLFELTGDPDLADRARPLMDNVAQMIDNSEQPGGVGTGQYAQVEVRGQLTSEQARARFDNLEEHGGKLIQAPFATGNLKEDDYENHEVSDLGEVLIEGLSEQEKEILRIRILLANARTRKDTMFTPDQAKGLPERFLISWKDMDTIFSHSYVNEATSLYAVVLEGSENLPEELSKPEDTTFDTEMENFRQRFRNFLASKYGINQEKARESEIIAFNLIQLFDLADDFAARSRKLGGFVCNGYKGIMNPRMAAVSGLDKQKVWPTNELGDWIREHRQAVMNNPSKIPLTDKLFVSFVNDPDMFDNKKIPGTNQKTTFMDYLRANGSRVLKGQRADRIPWWAGTKDKIFTDYEVNRVGAAVKIIKTLSSGEADKIAELENAFAALGTVDRQTRETLRDLYLIKKSGGRFNPKDDAFRVGANFLERKGMYDGFEARHRKFFE